jgi:hypothetical protein
MRSIDKKLKVNNTQISRSKRDDALKPLVAKLEAANEKFNQQKSDLAAKIPAEWEPERGKFVILASALKKARSQYRNNVDGAYEPIAEIEKKLSAVDALAAMELPILDLRAVILAVSSKADAKPAMEVIKAVESQLGSISGSSAIRSKLSKARRALKKVKIDKSIQEFEAAIVLLKEDVAWRQRAATELLPALKTYDESIRMTIGMRLQERLTIEQAKSIASCLSIHRDVSLNF